MKKIMNFLSKMSKTGLVFFILIFIYEILLLISVFNCSGWFCELAYLIPAIPILYLLSYTDFYLSSWEASQTIFLVIIVFSYLLIPTIFYLIGFLIEKIFKKIIKSKGKEKYIYTTIFLLILILIFAALFYYFYLL